MINEEIEELAALHALGLLDEHGLAALRAAAEADPAVHRLIDEMDEAAAAFALEAPQQAPPAELRRWLLQQIAVPSAASSSAAPRTRGFSRWLPYAVAACLAGLLVWQQSRLIHLQHGVRSARDEVAQLRAHEDMVRLQLMALEAKDTGYGSAHIMVAWDPKMAHGVVSIQDMPAPPPGKDYQLWVLDPSAPAPINAGLLKMAPGSHYFAVQPVASPSPGFAVSLEPAGGMPKPTGEILFAAAPQ